jgi:purine-nucleoside phosphorylase
MSSTADPRLQESLKAIRDKTQSRPILALVLGSGLGDFADSLRSNVMLETRDIPHYPVSTIEGHRGRLAFAQHGGVELVAYQGRLHFYETGSVERVLYPIQIAHALGVRILIVTNAAGGIQSAYAPGDLMLISDQLNLTGETIEENIDEAAGVNPLYDKDLLQIAYTVATSNGIQLKIGVYGGVKGPSYETAAEVQMVRRLGGDAVGMSTVLETVFAKKLGMRILGISCITNKATGISLTKLDHAEVTGAANKAKRDFSKLLLAVIEEIAARGL